MKFREKKREIRRLKRVYYILSFEEDEVCDKEKIDCDWRTYLVLESNNNDLHVISSINIFANPEFMETRDRFIFAIISLDDILEQIKDVHPELYTFIKKNDIKIASILSRNDRVYIEEIPIIIKKGKTLKKGKTFYIHT